MVIDSDFPGAYQVEVADVDGDGKLDVIAVGGSTCAWYENPGWKKRVVTSGRQTPGIISSATADLNGDGKAEIAIAYEFAMNQPDKGQLLVAVQAASIDEPWKRVPVAAIGSIHRLRWGNVDRDKRPDLIVASLFGPDAKPPGYAEPAPLSVFRNFEWRGDKLPKADTAASRPVLHAIDVVDLFKNGKSWVLTADDLGTSLISWGKLSDFEPKDDWQAPRALTEADKEAAPAKRGASEVHIGRMADGQRMLATIEPWHGNRVAVYLASIVTGDDGQQSLAPSAAALCSTTRWRRDMRSGSRTWTGMATTRFSPDIAARITVCRCTISTEPRSNGRRPCSIARSPRRTSAGAIWMGTARRTWWWLAAARTT